MPRRQRLFTDRHGHHDPNWHTQLITCIRVLYFENARRTLSTFNEIAETECAVTTHLERERIKRRLEF
jgi:hypothetical protein